MIFKLLLTEYYLKQHESLSEAYFDLSGHGFSKIRDLLLPSTQVDFLGYLNTTVFILIII